MNIQFYQSVVCFDGATIFRKDLDLPFIPTIGMTIRFYEDAEAGLSLGTGTVAKLEWAVEHNALWVDLEEENTLCDDPFTNDLGYWPSIMDMTKDFILHGWEVWFHHPMTKEGVAALKSAGFKQTKKTKPVYKGPSPGRIAL